MFAVGINTLLNRLFAVPGYRRDELQSRLHGVDAVVMASRWYENSP